MLLFFTFLRQSNLAPRKPQDYDPTRHLAVGDIFFTETGIIVLIKWTKTLQFGKTVLLPIPRIQHRHCPVTAITTMLHQRQCIENKNSPLFVFPDTQTAMTSVYMQSALHTLLDAMGQQVDRYSLHSFRRGGATAAYQAGVDHTKIRRHGIWSSDCFWRYISQDTLASDVPQALANLVTQT